MPPFTDCGNKLDHSLSILAKAAKNMWALGRCFSISLQQRRKRSRQIDIHPYLRCVKARTGPFTLSDSSFEDNPLDILLAEPPTLPHSTGCLRRTGTFTGTKLQSQRPTTMHHNYFSLTRWRQDQLRQPRICNLHSGSWDAVTAFDWLLDQPRGSPPVLPSVTVTDDTDSPNNTYLNTNNNDSTSSPHNSDNNNTDNFYKNDCSDRCSVLIGSEAPPRGLA